MLLWINALAGVLAGAYFLGRAYMSAALSNTALFANREKALSHKQLLFLQILMTSFQAILGTFIIATDADLRNSPAIIWLIVAATAIFALMVPNPVTVTPQGLTRANNFRPDTIILWNELDHYTIKPRQWDVPHVYCFYATNGRSIKVNDWAQSGEGLLKQIQKYKTLPEQQLRSNSQK